MSSPKSDDPDDLYDNLEINNQTSPNPQPNSSASEADLNLFDDFIISKENEKVTKETKTLKLLLEKSEAEVKVLKEKCEGLEEDNKTLLQNISSLWKTATAQLREKDKKLAKLHKDNEAIIFRRAMRQIPKDELDRVVSRIAAYDKQNFAEFMETLSGRPEDHPKPFYQGNKRITASYQRDSSVRESVMGRRVAENQNSNAQVLLCARKSVPSSVSGASVAVPTARQMGREREEVGAGAKSEERVGGCVSSCGTKRKEIALKEGGEREEGMEEVEEIECESRETERIQDLEEVMDTHSEIASEHPSSNELLKTGSDSLTSDVQKGLDSLTHDTFNLLKAKLLTQTKTPSESDNVGKVEVNKFKEIDLNCTPVKGDSNKLGTSLSKQTLSERFNDFVPETERIAPSNRDIRSWKIPKKNKTPDSTGTENRSEVRPRKETSHPNHRNVLANVENENSSRNPPYKFASENRRSSDHNKRDYKTKNHTPEHEKQRSRHSSQGYDRSHSSGELNSPQSRSRSFEKRSAGNRSRSKSGTRQLGDKEETSVKEDRSPKSGHSGTLDRHKSPKRRDRGEKSPRRERSDKSPRRERSNKSPRRERSNKSPRRDRGDKSPRRERSDKSPRRDKREKSPRIERPDKSSRRDRSVKSPRRERYVKSPRRDRRERSPRRDRREKSPRRNTRYNSTRMGRVEKSPRRDRADKSPKLIRKEKSPRMDRGDKSPQRDKCDKSSKTDTGDRLSPKRDREEREHAKRDWERETSILVEKLRERNLVGRRRHSILRQTHPNIYTRRRKKRELESLEYIGNQNKSPSKIRPKKLAQKEMSQKHGIAEQRNEESNKENNSRKVEVTQKIVRKEEKNTCLENKEPKRYDEDKMVEEREEGEISEEEGKEDASNHSPNLKLAEKVQSYSKEQKLQSNENVSFPDIHICNKELLGPKVDRQNHSTETGVHEKNRHDSDKEVLKSNRHSCRTEVLEPDTSSPGTDAHQQYSPTPGAQKEEKNSSERKVRRGHPSLESDFPRKIKNLSKAVLGERRRSADSQTIEQDKHSPGPNVDRHDHPIQHESAGSEILKQNGHSSWTEVQNRAKDSTGSGNNTTDIDCSLSKEIESSASVAQQQGQSYSISEILSKTSNIHLSDNLSNSEKLFSDINFKMHCVSYFEKNPEGGSPSQSSFFKFVNKAIGHKKPDSSPEHDTFDQIVYKSKQSNQDSIPIHNEDSEMSLLQYICNMNPAKCSPEKNVTFIAISPPPFVMPTLSPSKVGEASHLAKPTNVSPLNSPSKHISKSPKKSSQVMKNDTEESQSSGQSSAANAAAQSSSTDTDSHSKPDLLSPVFSLRPKSKDTVPTPPSSRLPYSLECLQALETPRKTLSTSSCSPIPIATPLDIQNNLTATSTPPPLCSTLKSSTPVVVFDLDRRPRYGRHTLLPVHEVVSERERLDSSPTYGQGDDGSVEDTCREGSERKESCAKAGETPDPKANIHEEGELCDERQEEENKLSTDINSNGSGDAPTVLSAGVRNEADLHSQDNSLPTSSVEKGPTKRKKVPFYTLSRDVSKNESSFSKGEHYKAFGFASSFYKTLDEFTEDWPSRTKVKPIDPQVQPQEPVTSPTNVSKPSTTSSSSNGSTTSSSSSSSSSSSTSSGSSSGSSSSCSTCVGNNSKSSKANAASRSSSSNSNSLRTSFTNSITKSPSPKKAKDFSETVLKSPSPSSSIVPNDFASDLVTDQTDARLMPAIKASSSSFLSPGKSPKRRSSPKSKRRRIKPIPVLKASEAESSSTFPREESIMNAISSHAFQDASPGKRSFGAPSPCGKRSAVNDVWASPRQSCSPTPHSVAFVETASNGESTMTRLFGIIESSNDDDDFINVEEEGRMGEGADPAKASGREVESSVAREEDQVLVSKEGSGVASQRSVREEGRETISQKEGVSVREEETEAPLEEETEAPLEEETVAPLEEEKIAKRKEPVSLSKKERGLKRTETSPMKEQERGSGRNEMKGSVLEVQRSLRGKVLMNGEDKNPVFTLPHSKPSNTYESNEKEGDAAPQSLHSPSPTHGPNRDCARSSTPSASPLSDSGIALKSPGVIQVRTPNGIVIKKVGQARAPLSPCNPSNVISIVYDEKKTPSSRKRKRPLDKSEKLEAGGGSKKTGGKCGAPAAKASKTQGTRNENLKGEGKEAEEEGKIETSQPVLFNPLKVIRRPIKRRSVNLTLSMTNSVSVKDKK